MGGIGSGRYHGYEKKPVVDGRPVLDINALQRHKMFRPGKQSIVRSNTGGLSNEEIIVDTDPHIPPKFMTVSDGIGPPRSLISLAYTKTGYGRRVWFLCPEAACRRRIVKLYRKPNKRFACRTCEGLAYATQCQGPWERALHMAQMNRRKLGGSINLLTSFPSKPRYMRNEKYLSLLEAEVLFLKATQRDFARQFPVSTDSEAFRSPA